MKPAHVVCIGLMLAGTMLLAQANPVPFVNQPLVPMTAAPGGAEFTLTVNGTGFVSASVVNWNGAPLTTTFVTGSKLTAIVPASNIATAGTASVTVVSPPPGGGVSNVEFFDISSPRGADVTFTQLPVYTAAAFVDKPIAADVNGDGKLDLAMLSTTSTTS